MPNLKDIAQCARNVGAVFAAAASLAFGGIATVQAQERPPKIQCMKLGTDVPTLLKVLQLDAKTFAGTIKKIGWENANPAACQKLLFDAAIATQSCEAAGAERKSCTEAEKLLSQVTAGPYCQCTALYTFILSAGQQIMTQKCQKINVGDQWLECEKSVLQNRIDLGVIAIIKREKAGADAEARGNCADEVRSEIESGRLTREKLTVILAGRPAKEVGVCAILDRLRKE